MRPINSDSALRSPCNLDYAARNCSVRDNAPWRRAAERKASLFVLLYPKTRGEYIVKLTAIATAI